MRYSKIKYCDISNGLGVRTSLFVSGCPHHCQDCFNKETWDYEYGDLFTTETINTVIESLSPHYISGLSVLGGEPLAEKNRNDVRRLVEVTKEIYPQKSIWIYTGYTYEELFLEKDDTVNKILKGIDILVDGRFVEKLYDVSLKFKGSSNQRIISIRDGIFQSVIG